MSTDPVATLHYERVEDVVRTLAASLANARLYPPRHPRVIEAVRTFVGAVGMFFTAHTGWEWVRIQYGGSVVSHRGVPLGEDGSCKDLHVASQEEVTYAYTAGYFGCYANGGVVVWATGRRHAWPEQMWQESWASHDYWLQRWKREELHQWHRHLPYGQGRWYDHLSGLYRTGYDSMSHAKLRGHRAQAYRTWDGKAVLPRERRQLPKPEATAKPKPHKQVAQDRADLYAGTDGKVYKRSHGHWYRQRDDKWVRVSRKPRLQKDEAVRKRLEEQREARRRKYQQRRRGGRYRSQRGRRGIAFYSRTGWWGGWGGWDGGWGGGGIDGIGWGGGW